MTSLRMHVRPLLGEPTLVLAFEGWNDACESATSALHILSDEMRTAPLAEIDPDEYYDFTVRRPRTSYRGGSVSAVRWPRNEFRYGVTDEERELIIGIGVEPHLRWQSFCDAVVELAVDMGVSRCLLLGAYLADVVYSQPVVVTGFATESSLLERVGVEATTYEGPVGIVGVLASELAQEGIEIVSLWAGLPHYISATPNPRGALALLRKASLLLGVEVDLARLRDDAHRFEQEISRVVAEDDELSEYVKELKRREFAQ